MVPVLPVIDIHAATVMRGQTKLLQGVSWRVAPEERWVVLGPNGAGKTTLLNLAAARLFPTEGTVQVLGETLGRVDVNELRTRIGLTTVALHDRIVELAVAREHALLDGLSEGERRTLLRLLIHLQRRLRAVNAIGASRKRAEKRSPA